jgi:hypothetical protein
LGEGERYIIASLGIVSFVWVFVVRRQVSRALLLETRWPLEQLAPVDRGFLGIGA